MTGTEPVEGVTELADRVERLVEGDDVAFPTDRDDELGRLAAALEELAEQWRERERPEHRRRDTDDILDAVDDLCYALDEAGRLLRWNEAVGEVTGYTDAELEGMDVREFFPEDERERIEKRIEETFEGDGQPVESTLLTKDGSRIPHEFVATRLHTAGETVLAGIGRDVTDRVGRERELERTADFLEETQRIASVGGWELDLRGDPPHEGKFTDELFRIHGLPVGAEVDMERGLEFYHPDHHDRVRAAVERAIETGEGYEVEAILVTADGEQRWIRTTGVPVYEDGELVALRGALQDITEQKERERALESLQETARGLLETESAAEVAELVVDRAGEFLEEPCLAVYLLDEETSQLEPAAVSEACASLEGPESVPIDRAESALWDAFTNGEVRAVDAGAEEPCLPSPALERGLVLPLGEHGVFVVGTPGEELADSTRRLAETLVATTETALDRLESEALLRQREVELADQNRRLRRQVQITDIIRSIHSSLIGADSRTDIEQTVCERLVEADRVRLAWIGSGGGDAELTVRAWAGAGQEYLDDRTGGEPSAITARTGEPTVVGNVVEGLGDSDWRQRALLEEFHSVVSVPLVFDEFSAGVLTVYADEPHAFGELERTVFAELGRSIANAITAANTRQAIHAESLVELTVRLDRDSVFTRIATAAECQLTYEGLAAREEGSRLFLTTVGAPAETVRDVLDELVAVTDATLVSAADDECLFEVTVAEESLPARLARYGGRLRSVEVTERGLEFVVDVSPTTDVRDFLDVLEAAYGGVDLVSRRDVERSIRTRPEFLGHLLDELTDRQLEVLRTAYHAGFFEWPRASTGEEIAEMLGVTQPTVNRHIRIGQQRLLEALFEHDAVDG